MSTFLLLKSDKFSDNQVISRKTENVVRLIFDVLSWCLGPFRVLKLQASTYYGF